MISPAKARRTGFKCSLAIDHEGRGCHVAGGQGVQCRSYAKILQNGILFREGTKRVLRPCSEEIQLRLPTIYATGFVLVMRCSLCFLARFVPFSPFVISFFLLSSFLDNQMDRWLGHAGVGSTLWIKKHTSSSFYRSRFVVSSRGIFL